MILDSGILSDVFSVSDDYGSCRLLSGHGVTMFKAPERKRNVMGSAGLSSKEMMEQQREELPSTDGDHPRCIGSASVVGEPIDHTIPRERLERKHSQKKPRMRGVH